MVFGVFLFLKHLARPTIQMEETYTNIFGDKPVISVKEARKLLGKELSEQLSDAGLMEVVSLMSHLTITLLEHNSVPQNVMVEV